jgi:hypothetical protein
MTVNDLLSVSEINTLRTGHLNCFLNARSRVLINVNQLLYLFLEEFIKNSLTVFVN